MHVSSGATSSKRWIRSLTVAATFGCGLMTLQAFSNQGFAAYAAAVLIGTAAEYFVPQMFSFLRLPSHLTRGQRRLAEFGTAAYIVSLVVVATLAAQVAAAYGSRDIAIGIACVAVALTSAVSAAAWPDAPVPHASKAHGMRGAAG
jgi:hypothetical protein